MVAACWDLDEGAYALGMRGAVFGLVYGAHYLFRKRWILKFPIIQVFFFGFFLFSSLFSSSSCMYTCNVLGELKKKIKAPI